MIATGAWHCRVCVFSEEHIIKNGELVLIEPAVIGAPIEHTTHLTVISKLSHIRVKNLKA